jgi:hypothetical protein
VLVVLAPSENDPQWKEQRAIDAAGAAGFSERDLIEAAELGAEGPLHRKFGINVDDFQVLLIGKDGHVALQWAKPVGAEVLYSVIDRMPMRRDEMRRQKRDNSAGRSEIIDSHATSLGKSGQRLEASTCCPEAK